MLVDAKAGDVFVLPAGTAHKTFDTYPEKSFTLLTPGTGHGVDISKDADGGGVEEVLGKIELEGFTMMGAYPEGSGEWDFRIGGEDVGSFERVWGVRKPERDPVLGESVEGTCGLWVEK